MPDTKESLDQYITRRTSDDSNQHWNLNPRDLEAMRYLIAQVQEYRNLFEVKELQKSIDLARTDTARRCAQIADLLIPESAAIENVRNVILNEFGLSPERLKEFEQKAK
jgi:hypothetical protein